MYVFFFELVNLQFLAIQYSLTLQTNHHSMHVLCPGAVTFHIYYLVTKEGMSVLHSSVSFVIQAHCTTILKLNDVWQILSLSLTHSMSITETLVSSYVLCISERNPNMHFICKTISKIFFLFFLDGISRIY